MLTLTPTNGFTFTVEGQIASGIPLEQYGPITAYESVLPDGTVVERYSRTSAYSNSLRTGWSFPIDLKADWHGYFHHSKIRWDYYLAVQDVLAPLYHAGASGPAVFDPWTGSTLTGSSVASYNLPYPIPSFGLSVSY